MSLFDSGCDDGAAGVAPAAGDATRRIAAVDRYMLDLDRALARQPTTVQRRQAWATLLEKWRAFAAGDGGLAGVADRYLAVAGAFAANLGAAAPAPPPAPAPAPAPAAKESHWLRWTLIAGGIGTAGYFGWRWYRARSRQGMMDRGFELLERGEADAGTAGPGAALPELSDRVRVLTTAAPRTAAPPWVRDPAIWAQAEASVQPYRDRYYNPDGAVLMVYRKLGGRFADRMAA